MSSYKEILEDEVKFKETCKKTFNEFDKDNSGYIEANEFVFVMKFFCKNLNIPDTTPCETYDKFKKLDIDRDGKLDLNEFSVIVKEILEISATQ